MHVPPAVRAVNPKWQTPAPARDRTAATVAVKSLRWASASREECRGRGIGDGLFAVFIEASDFAGRSNDWTANFDWVLAEEPGPRSSKAKDVNKAEAVAACISKPFAYRCTPIEGGAIGHPVRCCWTTGFRQTRELRATVLQRRSSAHFEAMQTARWWPDVRRRRSTRH